MIKSWSKRKRYTVFILLPAFLFTAIFIKKTSLPAGYEGFVLLFLYLILALYMAAGMYFEAWYMTEFRNTVGYPKFFLTIIFQVVSIFLLVYFLGYDIHRIFKLLFVILYISAYILIIWYLYRSAMRRKDHRGTIEGQT